MDSGPESVRESKFPTLKKFFSEPYGISLIAVAGIMVLSCIMSPFFGLVSYSVEFIYTLAILAMLLSYGLVLFVPAISLAVSRGWKAGVSVVVCEVIWMASIVLLISLLFPSPEITY